MIDLGIFSKVVSNGPEVILGLTGITSVGYLIYYGYTKLLAMVDPFKYLNIVTNNFDKGLQKIDNFIDKLKTKKETEQVGKDLEKRLLSWIDSRISQLKDLKKKLQD